MHYQDRLAAMRTEIAGEHYDNALEMGRAELERGCGSSDVLLLMATAGQLSDGNNCSLDEVHGWLKQATIMSPESPEAWLELGHFLDAVADEPQLAASAFEKALEKSVGCLAATLDGLGSTSSLHDEAMQGRLSELRKYALSLLSP
jgi:hypothetical protein